MAKEILNAPPLSEEESKEMRDLYRLLVKQLHPDLHPDQSDREAALFLQVQAAYKICDLYKLREIAPASQTANTQSVTFGSIFQFYLGLTNRLHKDNTILGKYFFPQWTITKKGTPFKIRKFHVLTSDSVGNKSISKRGRVCIRADNCPNEREFIICSFRHYLHLCPCTSSGWY